MQKIIATSLLLFCLGLFKSQAQSLKSGDLQTITTAVPFLTITPDARAGGMGDVGVATSPDANATFWNPAKLAFIKTDMGVAISYNPWLRKLVNDMSLSYISAYKKLRKEDAIAINFEYFNLGQVTFTDNAGGVIRDFQPNEFAIGTDYSRMLSKHFSLGLGLKFFRSDLAGNYQNSTTGQISKSINSVAADIGAYYTKDMLVKGKNSNLGLGLCISNIGPKVTYTTVDQKDFIPTNLRLGGTYTIEADQFNKFSASFDANKLLVPSMPWDSTGKNPKDMGIAQGMMSSFVDSPGGFKGELNEIILCMGAEYWYTDIFAVRGGY
ncbi:MAG: type IX secretion system outer membrane channel protein PorV, partial [Cytophagales bacterium]|nr:type IX secretion system outer membrane channel protein PorV [Cytophaga sp.]